MAPVQKDTGKYWFYMSADRNTALGIRKAQGHYKVYTHQFTYPDGGYTSEFCFYGKKVGPVKYRGKTRYWGSEAGAVLLPRSIKIMRHGKTMTLWQDGRSSEWARTSSRAIEIRGQETGSSSFDFKGLLWGRC